MMDKIREYTDNQDYKAPLRATIIILLSIILVVGANALVNYIPESVSEIDFSSGHLYSISEESTKKAAEINRPVELLFLCEEGEENKSTMHILNRYAAASEYIKVTQIDPIFEPQKLEKYTDEGVLESNSVIVSSGDKFQIIDYSEYYVGTSFILEDLINGALDYVMDDSYRMVYNIVGHDEVQMTDELRRKIGLDGFKCEDIDLSQLQAVPDDARVLIINGLKTDLSGDEAITVLNYLKKGGKLILTTDYSSESLKILDSITSYFGAHMGEGVVLENREGFYLEDNASFVLPKITDTDQVLTNGVRSVVLPNSMPIIMEENPDTLNSFSVFETTEKSLTAHLNRFTGKTETVAGPFVIGARFSKEDGYGGEMIWVSSRYFSGEELPEDLECNNTTAFLNAVSELGADEPVPSLNGKIIASQLLQVDRAQALAAEIVLIIVIPLLFVAFGLVVCIKRKNR